jgi:hypothetical protein
MKNFANKFSTDEIYFQLCVEDKVTQLYRDTCTGVAYWRQHKRHKCYKCRKYGHLAEDCDKVCKICDNIHSTPVCLYKMTQLFEEICIRIKKMKTKEQLIAGLEETKKAIINQVNKSKQEIQKEAKKLYSQIQQESFQEIQTASEEFLKIRERKKPEGTKQIILKPRVCTSFSLTAMTIKPLTENLKNKPKLEPVFTMCTNRMIYNEEKKLIKAGQQLFRDIKWLPTIQLKNEYKINKIPVTIKNSLNEKDIYQTIFGWNQEREYHNNGSIIMAQQRVIKFTSNNPEIKEKEDYIEKINRRIEGARHLTSYYQSQYEYAIAGIKCLDQMMNFNEELDKKAQIKEDKIKQLNKITEENIKNNRAKVNKIKNEIKDLKKKREKNVKKYQDARYRAEKERHKTHYYEQGRAAAWNTYNKINQSYQRLNQYKNECYNKIKRAADRNEVNLEIKGFDHYN